MFALMGVRLLRPENISRLLQEKIYVLSVGRKRTVHDKELSVIIRQTCKSIKRMKWLSGKQRFTTIVFKLLCRTETNQLNAVQICQQKMFKK